jgi:ribosomal protein S27E
MDVEVTCRDCRKHYLIKARFAGQKVKCRHCGNAMLVPEERGARGQGPGEDAGARGQGPGVREQSYSPLHNTLFDCQQPSDADTKVSFAWEETADWLPPPISVCCDGCGKTYRAPEELAGRQIRCRNCGTAVHVPAAESATVTMEMGE